MKVFVPMGDRRVRRDDGTLSISGLGSCVAIALYDAERRVGGIAHVLLPDPSYSKRDRAWLFATTAVPALIREMEGQGAGRRRMTARLIGGAAMFQDIATSERPNIGQRNVAAARDALIKSGIPLIAEDVGGAFGRSLDFCVRDGHVRVSSQGRAVVEI